MQVYKLWLTLELVEGVQTLMSLRQKFLVKLYAFLWCALWYFLIFNHGFELIRFSLLAVFLAIPACSVAPSAKNPAAASSPRQWLREYFKKIRPIFYDPKNATLCKLSLFFFTLFMPVHGDFIMH
jgi:hypothetical protein